MTQITLLTNKMYNYTFTLNSLSLIMINNNNNNLFNNDNDIPITLSQQTVISSPAPTITFAIHNVSSLQYSIKNQFINDFFADFNTDFVDLTETRHKTDQTFCNLFDPTYTSYWSNNINPHASVSILIKILGNLCSK